MFHHLRDPSGAVTASFSCTASLSVSGLLIPVFTLRMDGPAPGPLFVPVTPGGALVGGERLTPGAVFDCSEA